MEKKKVRRYTRREVRRNRMIAFCCLIVLAILLIALIVWGIKNLVSGDDGKSSSESSLGTVSTFQSSSPDNASNSGQLFIRSGCLRGQIHQQMNLLPVLPALRPPQRFLPALPHLLSIPVIHIMNPPCRFW